MTWTTARPTQAGWYWWRSLIDKSIVWVTKIEEYELRYSLLEGWASNGEWAGPIPEPEEPHA